MIRVCGTKIIVPRGDTGIFTLPVVGISTPGDLAIFSVYDKLTRNTVLEKFFDASENFITIFIEHQDTVDLEPGKYVWDLKIYKNPIYDEEENLIGAMEINSYYSAFHLPLFLVKEATQNV